MISALIIFVLLGIVEYLFFQYDFLNDRIINVLITLLTALSAIYLIYKAPNIIILFVFGASLYRVFNLFRVIRPRMFPSYLISTTKRTSHQLLYIQALTLIIYEIFDRTKHYGLMMHYILYAILYLQLILAVIVVYSTVVNRRLSMPKVKNDLSSDLPTVSVCIPARNESDELRECLDRLLASDYPKLEIIVLDDCSTVKHTPEIIRSYAQSGVIFLSGTPPPSYWLAKNWAYDQLSKIANGEIIIFSGVDARYSKETISLVVSEMENKNLRMLSIIPTLDNLKTNPFVQTMRYWWELALPRKILNRPPVISTFWAIETASLKRLGSFNANRRMITPEAYFAKKLFVSKSYSFLRDNGVFGISTDKTSPEQNSTAVRVRYPQLHKRPENVFVFSSFVIVTTIVPFIGALVLWITNPPAAIISIVTALCYVYCYSNVIKEVRHQRSLSTAFMFPFAVLIDLVIMQISMFKYEFSTVNWKGRNICIPVMHMTSSSVGRRSLR